MQYDIFLNKSHPSWLKNVFRRYNENILKLLFSYFPSVNKLSILEIGPGKGYFYQATRSYGKRIAYSALDRSKSILEHLGIRSTILGTAPKIPATNRKFDIIYAAYLIEHLKNGEEIYELIKNCKKNLRAKGIIVFIAPDVLSQKFEFYAADYTHGYPVTKRAVAMAFADNGLKDVDIYDFLDVGPWLSHKPVIWIWSLLFIKTIMVFYNYHFASIIFSFLAGKKSYIYDNWFYKLYGFTKVKNIIFIGKNN